MATILLVDDDADVLEVLALGLRETHHKVLTASSGVIALDILDHTSVDLIVTDILMPGLHGFALARMANYRRPVKVIYLTGYLEESVALQDGGIRYGKVLYKPLLPSAFRKEVEDALR
jgi:two-component system response regulator YesN